MTAPICRDCEHVEDRGPLHGGLRGWCYCQHPAAIKSFTQYGGKAQPGFIAFTTGWRSHVPDIKTSPRWCPLRHPRKEEPPE